MELKQCIIAMLEDLDESCLYLVYRFIKGLRTKEAH